MFHHLAHLLSQFWQFPISPSRTWQRVEQPKSKPTQPSYPSRWTTLYLFHAPPIFERILVIKAVQLQFHEVGKAISLYGDVVHYGYSMNWTTETFGSNILDYLMFDDYDTANDLINMALGEGYIAEKHGAAGRRRGSNSKPGNEISVQLVTVFERK